MRTLTLAISPCPNDTFMFHDLVHGRSPVAGVLWQTELCDIETLNLAALESPPRFDVTKLSLPAVAARLDEYSILDAGAALGRGCGPLVVTREDAPIRGLDDLAGRRVLIPGAHTTAFLLLRSFAPRTLGTATARFDRIMPAVAAGEADAGLIIHESRFTYPDHGLRAVADLGELWETTTGLPLPLGVIAARRSLPEELVAEIGAALSRSVRNALADPAPSAAFVREHADEMDPEVCRAHIGLYVNGYSVALGAEGRRAIDELLARGRQAGLLPAGRPAWRRAGEVG